MLQPLALDLVPLWPGQRLFFASDDSSSEVQSLRLERSSHAQLPRAPTPSLIDEC